MGIGGRSSFYAQVAATTNTVANTDDWAIVITPPAGTTIAVKRIMWSYSAGTVTPIRDDYFRIKPQSLTGATSGGASFTPVRLAGSSRSSGTTALIKNSTTNFTGGTPTAVYDVMPIWASLAFEWSARDVEDEFTPAPAELFGISISCSSVSRTFSLGVIWSESY